MNHPIGKIQKGKKEKHVNSILRQAHNKSALQDMDIDYYLELQTEKAQSSGETRTTKSKGSGKSAKKIGLLKDQHDSSKTLNESHENKQNEDSQEKSMEKLGNILELPQQQSRNELTPVRNTFKKRVSSRIQVKLQEIQQYKIYFPIRQVTHKSISNKINKISSYTNRFINNNNPNQIKEPVTEVSTPEGSKSRFFKRKDKNCSQHKIFKENMLLHMVDEDTSKNNQSQKAKLSISRYKNLSKSENKNKLENRCFDFTLKSFFQHNASRHYSKKERKTVNFCKATSSQKENQLSTHQHHKQFKETSQSIDIRNQNIVDIQRFIRGDPRQDEELTKWISTNEIRQLQSKYDLFEKIYAKVKEEFNSQNFQVNAIKDPSIRNIAFLEEAYKQQNHNFAHRQQILKTMKKVNFWF